MLNAGIDLYALVGLHTKLYLFDTDDAIVGSANFTEGGLVKNIELSLHMKEEEAIDRLHEYFDKIVDKVKKEKDGIITQDMLDDYKISYEKHKRTKTKLEGGNSIIGTIRGAVLDRNARNIIEDTNGIYNEIQNNIGERLKDCVYLVMGGKNEKVSHKRLKNIILKFSASSKDREDGNKPMPMYPFKDDGKLVYVSNFSSVKSAEKIEDDDEVFFCAHSYNKNGKPCPIIVGKGYFRKYNQRNDARKKGWCKEYAWLLDYPVYCVISEAKIINAPINCCIPLREVTDEIGYKTYIHTQDYPGKNVTNLHSQKTMLSLTSYAKEYIDGRLDELGEKYGWNNYKSEI